MYLLRVFVVIIINLILVSQIVDAQNIQGQTRQKEYSKLRIQRLSGLAEIWGATKYFHPYLAHKEIEWDKALIEAIPLVNAAKTSEEYRDAINKMLAVLNDKNTYAEIIEGEPKKEKESKIDKERKKKAAIEVKTNTLIINGHQIAKEIDENRRKTGSFLGKFYLDYVNKLSKMIEEADAIVIDGRSNGIGNIEKLYFKRVFRSLFEKLINGKLVLGASRYRQYTGYPFQNGLDHPHYYSALVSRSFHYIYGKRKTGRFTPPVVFILDKDTPLSVEFLSSLQNSNTAVLIEENETGREIGRGSYSLKLTDKVSVSMRTNELLKPNGSIGFTPDKTVFMGLKSDEVVNFAVEMLAERSRKRKGKATAEAKRNTSLASKAQKQGEELFMDQKDKPYARMSFPNYEFRLLSLFRFWNIVKFFYPYKNLIEKDWKEVLLHYIPDFEDDKDAFEFEMTLRKLGTELHDSHVSFRGVAISDNKLGMYAPEIQIRNIEGEFVVVKAFSKVSGVKVGDTILAIDNKTVKQHLEFWSKVLPSSTPQAFLVRVRLSLLRGQKDSLVKLRVRSAKGGIRLVSLQRSISALSPSLLHTSRTTPVVQILPSGFGYVDLDRLNYSDIDKMFEKIKGTRATVFDMRGFPRQTAWGIAPRLTARKNVIGATFAIPILKATYLGQDDFKSGTFITTNQTIPDREGDVYRGKVVMLINADAISQAEHTCLFFDAAADTTFIGTPTNGANGPVTRMLLPGNRQVTFTGAAVRFADGRQLQRVGVQPHIRIEPTIKGLVEGRDEVLERAVKFMKSTTKRK